MLGVVAYWFFEFTYSSMLQRDSQYNVRKPGQLMM